MIFPEYEVHYFTNYIETNDDSNREARKDSNLTSNAGPITIKARLNFINRGVD